MRSEKYIIKSYKELHIKRVIKSYICHSSSRKFVKIFLNNLFYIIFPQCSIHKNWLINNSNININGENFIDF